MQHHCMFMHQGQQQAKASKVLDRLERGREHKFAGKRLDRSRHSAPTSLLLMQLLQRTRQQVFILTSADGSAARPCSKASCVALVASVVRACWRATP